MALSNFPYFPQSITTISVGNVATQTVQNVVQGGVNGSKVEAIVLTSNDTVDHALAWSLNVSGVLTLLANVNVPANSGNLTTPPVVLFQNTEFSFLNVDPMGNKFLLLANTACSLVCNANSKNSTAAAVSVSGQAENY